MGTWGTELYEDDIALDIKNAFESLINDGKSFEEATELIIKDNEDLINDTDDRAVFWLALADTQWNLGNLLSKVQEKALQHLENDQDLKKFEEVNTDRFAERKKVLDELEKKLKSTSPIDKNKKSRKKKKCRAKLGDIFCIPLPNGKFAYARLFKEYTIGVYKNTYSNYKELPLIEDYAFFVGVYKDVLQNGDWEVIDNRSFKSDDEAWPPPKCIKDVISGKYSLYYKGEIIPSTEQDCKGLEHAAVWDKNHIVDRIMGETKWNIS